MFNTAIELKARGEADVLILPFWEKPNKPKPVHTLSKTLEEAVKAPLMAKDFQGKEGELSLIYLPQEKEKRALLVGLGKEEEASLASFRKIFATLSRFLQKKKWSHVNLLLPTVAELRSLSLEECLRGVVEGLLLTNYNWNSSDEKPALLKTVTLIGILPKEMAFIQKLQKILEAVYFARDLVNGNADHVTPQYLAKVSQKLSEEFKEIKTTILEKKEIEKEKMGLFLAVSQGSSYDPRFIIVRYVGAPRSKEHTVLIGKGITFDTGGLNLKPTGSMETMRGDMAGAAAVLGTMAALAHLNLKVNVTAVIAACENAIDAKSYRPGDVYKGLSGKTVEIGNTDAEGRLTLADAISYSIKHLNPTRLINLATLTGAIVVALGEDVAGLMSNDDALAQELEQAGEVTQEYLHRLPLFKGYKELLKSDIADLKNVTGKRSAGAITAGLFLEEFVQDVPWAHLDIAGTAFSLKDSPLSPKHGVGFGVRLLVEYLLHLSGESLRK